MTTLKQIKPILNKFKKQNRPLLRCALVSEGTLKVTDLETCITLKDTFDLSDGLHNIATIGLVGNSDHDINDYPVFSEVTSEFSYSINQDELSKYLIYASKDETRMRLCGVAFTKSGVCSTDGCTLRYKKEDLDVTQDLIVPRDSVALLIQLLKKHKIKDNIELHFDDSYMIVETEFFKLSARLILREFPRWTAIIPKKFESSITITKWVDFKEVKPLLGWNNKSVISCEGGVVTLIIGNEFKAVVGHCNSSLKIEIGFNLEFLNRALSGLSESILEFNNELAPAAIGSVIVMPLKI